jgi:site-specific recombinase XerD
MEVTGMESITLKELVDRYVQNLARLGYCRSSIKNYKVFCRQLTVYFEKNGFFCFSEQHAMQFLDDCYGLSRKEALRETTRNDRHIRQMVRKIIRFHQDSSIGRVSPSSNKMIDSEELRLALSLYSHDNAARGLVKSTRENLKQSATRFLTFVDAQPIRHVAEITAQTIFAYMDTLAVYRYKTIGQVLTCLRSLLRFLHSAGLHPLDLSGIVPRRQARKGGSIPSVWSHDDVLRLIATIDQGNPCGKRDYAILLMVCRLGIRAGDIRNLKLDHIDWNRNLIAFAQSKTGQPVHLPLLKDVGWALIDYLRHGRPVCDSPYVFLSLNAPHRQLSEGNCFYHIIRRCLSLARIEASFKQKVGLHSLRHTLAGALLEKRTPLPVISGILGHASVETTGIYLKAAENDLRECSLSLPGGF